MDRLKILLDAKQINQETYETLQRVMIKIKDWNDDDKSRFITHLAVAISRIKNKTELDSLPESAIAEIEQHLKINEANKYFETLFENEKLDIPQNEKNYIMIHILNYLER